MIPEIGFFALIIALSLAFLQMSLPIYGFIRNESLLEKTAKPLSLGQCFFVTLSFLILAYTFYTDDFSVQYVVQHSNSTLPIFYKFSAIWAGHEGSLLLWVLILNFWTVAVVLRSKRFDQKSIDQKMITCILSILGLISVGFLIFLITTSNPFQRVQVLSDIPIEGRDLNPLLQDFGLIIHPPLLYLGYVGFSIPFAFAISSLLLNEWKSAWIQWLRPFVLVAFCFLTIGVALGSWWAYYELGWGGWWFWDPVENASLMPWLSGIALIHALIVNEKRNTFYGWTLILSIICFALSLLGTFLVRSGILTSVHAFATDPSRGIVLLIFFALIVGGALTLFAFKAKALFSGHETKTFSLVSRETLLLFTLIFVMIATFTVFLGTLFPIFYEVFTQKKISVGFPYFNLVFIPIIIPILLLLPLGPFTHWSQDEIKKVLNQLKTPIVLSFIVSFVILIFIVLYFEFVGSLVLPGFFGFYLGIFLGLWIAFGTLQRLIVKVKSQGMKGLSLGALGMCLAHFGVGILVIGIAVVTHFQIEKEIKMAPNQSIDIANYRIDFQKMDFRQGPNYLSFEGHFQIKKGDKIIANLRPEKRIFVVSKTAMSETAISPGFFSDIYIALGERLNDKEWSLRIYYKPFVRWIWLGAILIALGAMVAAMKKGKKRLLKSERIR